MFKVSTLDELQNIENQKSECLFNKPTPTPPDVKSGQALQGGE